MANARMIFSSQAAGGATAPLLRHRRDVFVSDDATAKANAESFIEHKRMNKI